MHITRQIPFQKHSSRKRIRFLAVLRGYRVGINWISLIRKHNATTTKEKQNIGGKIGGKIGSPKKKLVCVAEIKNRKGEVIAKQKDEFDSCEDASNKIGVGSTTISKYIKLGLLKKMK